jgi:hypothetical protein
MSEATSVARISRILHRKETNTLTGSRGDDLDEAATLQDDGNVLRNPNPLFDPNPDAT